jgi:hypothetical protein
MARRCRRAACTALALALALLASRGAGGSQPAQPHDRTSHRRISTAPRRARALRAETPAEEAQTTIFEREEDVEAASSAPAGSAGDGAGAGPLFSVLLRAAGVPPGAAKALVFDKLQSAVLTTARPLCACVSRACVAHRSSLQEAIALTDTAVSLVETYAADTGLLTVVPGSLFADAAAGKTVIVVLSALFNVANAELRNGTVGRVGLNIPLATVVGKNNLPGLFVGGGINVLASPPAVLSRGRRLLCSSRLASAIGAACPEAPAVPRRRRLLPAADLAALSDAGMWPALSALLPRQLKPRLAAALAALPHRHGGIAASARDAAAAASALGLDDFTASALRNFTLASPQGFTSPFLSSFVPLFDVELTTRLLIQENQNGASVRLGPTFRVAGDGTVAEGFLLLPQFTTFVTQTTQQLAAFAAGKLRAAAAMLAGDAAAAQQQRDVNAAALADYFGLQFGPLPTAAVIAFELVMRSQLSVNGGDLAAVI